jgi:phage shock protein E
MSRSKIFIALSVLLLASIACNFVAPAESTPPPLTVIVEPTLPPQGNVLQSEDQVPRVPIEQALGAVQSGAAVIIDVRSVQAYEDSHVPGALSIPLAEIEADPNGLPLDRDQWIITYCT